MMKIGALKNEYFAKNWHRKQGSCCVQRSVSTCRNTQRDFFLRSNHNYTDKYIMQSLPKGKRGVASNKKGVK